MRARAPSSIALLAALTGTVVGQAGAQCGEERPMLAVAQTLAVNFAVNRFDAVVLGAPWAKANFESWSRNLRLGWEWDENAFGTNLLMHPQHGGLYFNAGRANCLDFWEAVPLAFLGSWTWEYFGETHRPSLNDFVMTASAGSRWARCSKAGLDLPVFRWFAIPPTWAPISQPSATSRSPGSRLRTSSPRPITSASG